MTRPYYGNPTEVDYYRRSSRSMPLAISHGTRDEARSYPLGRRGSGASPVPDPESDKNGSQPRRRIAVACGRCRKRKIKCSGDPGNGTGCNNCKSAGTDMGQCQFLRVNSMECATSNGSVWPYSSSGSVSASATSQIGSSLGSYSLGQGSSLASMTPAPFSSASQYPRMPSGHGYTFAAPASRHGYAPAYGLGYGDDPTDAYSQQSPPYMLPSQDTIGMSSAYGSQDALRTWNPITQSSKNPHGGLFLDQESPPSYGLSQLPYLSSSMSRHPVVTADASSFFPAMTSLVSSLPMAGSTGDRTLPNPTAGRAHMQQANINTISHGSTGDAVPLTSQGLNYKSGVPWGPESVTSGGSQSSTSTLSGTSTLMDTSSMRPSTSNAQESAFGYIPLSGSPPAELAAPSILYNTPSLLSSVTNPSNHANSAASSFHRTSSKEPFLQSHNSSSDLYSYSNENSSKRGSFGEAGPSDSTLANGQQYTRLRQPQSQHAASPDALRQSSFESRSQVAPRTSISSISNARGY